MGWESDHWRIAGRGDVFHTATRNSFGAAPATSENGTALTAAVSWLPNDWLKLTGEILSVTSTRGERSLEGLDPQQTETEFQLSAKFYWE